MVCPNCRDGVRDPTLNLESDASVTEMNLTVQYSFQVQIGWVMDSVHASYRDYISQEVQPAKLVRESSTQLIKYSLDTCVRYSVYLPIFKSQKSSIKALKFLIFTS